MKKKIAIWILLVTLFCVHMLPATVYAKEVPDELKELYARSAVLMDADSGRILFGKDENVVRANASTTKIMTCILALEHMKEGQIAVVSDYAACQPKVRLGVCGKEEYLLKDLLYSLMLESHNDSAVVVAENISGSVEAFAELMNRKAKELGLKNTHFITPNGLDAENEGGIHGTTAADLAGIMRYCIMESPKKDDFLEITGTKNYSFSDRKGDRTFSCYNHNAFLEMMDGALSGKTGFTGDAGYCYVGALRRGQRTFIVALLACGWPNNKGYKWKDTKKLMDYGLANYDYQDVWRDMELEDIRVRGGVDENDPYSQNGQAEIAVESSDEKKGNVKHENEEMESLRLLLGKDEEVEVLTEVPEEVAAPVKTGEKVGTVSYLLHGDRIRTYNVVTVNEVEQRSFFWCVRWILRRFVDAA